MLKDHDMTKLEARGFRLRDEVARSTVSDINGHVLDGISANLQLDGSLRIQIYQGCQGVYELKGQGRGRPKKHVLVDLEWFTPSWSICKRQNDQWDDLAGGSAQDVDTAVSEALSRFRELFPDIPIPAGIA